MNAKQAKRAVLSLLPVLIALAIGLVAALPVHAIDDCCNIVSIDRKSGKITAINKASGETFEFTVGNNWLLKKLAPGTSFGTDNIEGVDVPPDALEANWGDGWGKQDLVCSGCVGTGDLAAKIPAVQLAEGVSLHKVALKRRGSRAIKLTFDITNETDNKIYLSSFAMLNANMNQLSAIALVDFDAGKRYQVVTDDTGKCVCSRGGALQVAAGTTKSFWAHFAAPPSDVTMLTFEIPGGVPVDDIPIQ